MVKGYWEHASSLCEGEVVQDDRLHAWGGDLPWPSKEGAVDVARVRSDSKEDAIATAVAHYGGRKRQVNVRRVKRVGADLWTVEVMWVDFS